jgi:electron transfer flavoprotein beta subunit
MLKVSQGYHIVVLGGMVPDPLQTLEPVTGPNGPSLKNEMMLPVVLDPWAAHALYEGANLARSAPGSKVWLVTLGPKAKVQQLMMNVAQKAAFELVALDGPASGFTDAPEVADRLSGAVKDIPGLDRSRMLLFGGWESASRGTGAVLQMVGESLGITSQFQGVDSLKAAPDGSFEVLERIEGGCHQVSSFSALPAAFGWATGSLPEPPNNPQLGMTNMRVIMPALAKAKPAQVGSGGAAFESVAVPSMRRETRIVKDMAPEAIAAEILEWLGGS